LIKKFSVYIGQYKKALLIVPFLAILDVLCELLMPMLMGKIVDVGIQTKDTAFIVRIGLFMILLALSAIAFGVLNMRFTTTASMGFSANLRNALFEKVQSFSFNNIDHFSTASLITRMTNDVNNLQMTFMMMLRILIRAPLMLVMAFILAFSINANLSVILLIAIVILSLSILVIMRTAAARFAIMQTKYDLLNNTLQENFIGIRVVKSFVRGKFEIDKFQKSNDALTHSAIHAVKIAILNMPVMMLVMNLTSLVIIWRGGQMVFANTLGTGQLISYISYIFQILMSVMMLSMVILMGSRAAASGKRILEVLETQSDIIEPEQPVVDESPLHVVEGAATPKTGKVEFKNVSFKYHLSDSGENVLTDISFTALPGQVIGIVGGTGTGKSTLVHLIPRLYDVTEGAVLVDDVDVREYNLDTLRAKIGVVLQKNTLFSGTIRENILWGNPGASDEDVIQACKDAQAHDFIMSFPMGYDTVLGQGGVNVSGGQKQRLCIARAMLKKPSILILDDSTSAVDTSTEAKIRTSFYHNLADTTVFIIAQRISSVCDADQILIIDDGKIAGIGTHAELLANNTIYQEINASQQEGAFING
jgi:ATP-binding cassette subfamily B protein